MPSYSLLKSDFAPIALINRADYSECGDDYRSFSSPGAPEAHCQPICPAANLYCRKPANNGFLLKNQ